MEYTKLKYRTMRATQEILKSRMSILDCTMDSKQLMAAEEAMIIYSRKAINDFQSDQNKAAIKESIKLIPALINGELMLWLRKRAFLRAKKKAQTLANIENRPFYVIRSGEISYLVQSTLVARTLKKRGVYKKEVTSIRLRETADFTAYPQKYHG